MPRPESFDRRRKNRGVVNVADAEGVDEGCAGRAGSTAAGIRTGATSIEWIVSVASPFKFLKTNIYSAPSEEAKDLTARDRLTAPFDFPLREIEPVVMLAHGNDAVNHLSMCKGLGKVVALPHLSRGWSELRAHEIVRRSLKSSDEASDALWLPEPSVEIPFELAPHN